jgi:DNA-binding NarL/FixJ family response regulator
MCNLKTYIVEDSKVILDDLIATLEELVPITVVGTAEDEATAVQWLLSPEHTFDLAIVDIFLKGGSGLGILSALKSLSAPHQKVVLSNFTSASMRRRCMELGADQVFDKSNEIEALLGYCCELASNLGRGSTASATSD